MSTCVLGLGHTGIVVSACLASAHREIIGYQPGPETVPLLERAIAPFHEDGLEQLLTEGLASGRLRYTSEPLDALANAETVLVCIDTPIKPNGQGDSQEITDAILWNLAAMRADVTLVVMSQVPVGTTRYLQDVTRSVHPGITWAVCPENMRTGHAVADFLHAPRVVIGTDEGAIPSQLATFFDPFTHTNLWTNFESAEMVKHGTNAWLALSITYANELGALCAATGANYEMVEAALRRDPRIGQNAYIAAGAPFGGGHLGRDVNYLLDMAEHHCLTVPVIDSIFRSNLAHGVRRGESARG